MFGIPEPERLKPKGQNPRWFRAFRVSEFRVFRPERGFQPQHQHPSRGERLQKLLQTSRPPPLVLEPSALNETAWRGGGSGSRGLRIMVFAWGFAVWGVLGISVLPQGRDLEVGPPLVVHLHAPAGDGFRRVELPCLGEDPDVRAKEVLPPEDLGFLRDPGGSTTMLYRALRNSRRGLLGSCRARIV